VSSGRRAEHSRGGVDAPDGAWRGVTDRSGADLAGQPEGCPRAWKHGAAAGLTASDVG